MTQHRAIAAGRTAVITGAASGVGLAASVRLAGLGLNVVMADRDTSRLAEARAEVEAAAGGAAVETLATDVADFGEVERLRDRAFERFGDVAVLMNNAGVGGGGHAFAN